MVDEQSEPTETTETIFVIRNNSNQPKIKRNKTIFHTVVNPMIEILHRCHTIWQFDSLGARVVDIWKALGEENYALWFSHTYLHDYWRLWFYNAGPPGTPCVNNLIESFNHHTLKKHLKNRCKETLEAALSPGGYLEKTLQHIDQFNAIDKLLFILPSYLSQLGLIAITAVPDQVIKKACSILIPQITQFDETHAQLQIKNPNIQHININTLTALNLGLENYLTHANDYYVVLSDNKRILTPELAMSYFLSNYPTLNDGEFCISLIDKIKDSLQKFYYFYKNIDNIHLVQKTICPIYAAEMIHRNNNNLLKFFLTGNNVQQLKYRTVYISSLKRLIEENKIDPLIDITNSEQPYGIITNVISDGTKHTVSIRINATSVPIILSVREVIPLLTPPNMYYYSCTCKYFHSNGYFCKHILAVWGLPSEAIYRTLQLGCCICPDINNNKKGGRPSKAEKARQFRKHYNGLIFLSNQRQTIINNPIINNNNQNNTNNNNNN
jgi:hypothetical protein